MTEQILKQEEIIIAGAGAIDALFGVRLAHSGYNATFIDGWVEHIRRIVEKGLEITDLSRTVL